MDVLNASPAAHTHRARGDALDHSSRVSVAHDADQDLCPAIVRRRIGNWMWQIRQDHAAMLEAGPAGGWEHVEADPAAMRVKQNDGREVWRLTRPDGDVFVKYSLIDNIPARLKRWLRGPACFSEWQAALYARQHAIPAVEPLACAYSPSRCGTAKSILITAALPDARPLHDVWADRLREAGSSGDYGPARRLIEALADLLATAHQRGLQHADLHPENLLVIGDPCADPQPRIAFVDLHGVQTHRPVSDTAVIRNLAQLNQWFRRHADITDRIRFLRRYLDTRQALSEGPLARPLGLSRKALVKALEQQAHRHAQRLYARRDRRAMRTNRYFATIRVPGGWRGHVFLSAKRPVAGSIASTLTFTRQQWRTWLAQPLGWLVPDEAWQMIKDSHSGTVCRRVLLTAPTPLPVVCKRPRSRNILRRVVTMLRRSRNLRAWQRGFALIHRNMPTAWPLAVLERRRFGLLLDSITINEALPDAHDLDAVISLELTRLAPTDQRRAKDLLIDALCRLVKRMHERHFFHRDFKASNIMIQWAPGFSVPPALSLVDLDGLRLKRRTDDRHVYRAVARLNVSLDHCRTVTRTDRLRFLRRFLSGWGREPIGWKALWHELDARSGHKRRQYRQHQAWKLEHYGRT